MYDLMLRRRQLDEARLDALVVRRGQRRGEARAQRTKQAGGGRASDGVARRRGQEIATRDAAVYVLVEQLQYFRIKIGGGLAGHVSAPWAVIGGQV